MFLVDLPDPAIRIDRIPHTIDSLMPGGHAIVTIDALRVPVANILGEPHAGFKYAQVRLSPERCLRTIPSPCRCFPTASWRSIRPDSPGRAGGPRGRNPPSR